MGKATENMEAAPSDWDFATLGTASLVSQPHPVKQKGQTLGKADSLLVLPNNWEGKRDSMLLQRFWVESFQG